MSAGPVAVMLDDVRKRNWRQIVGHDGYFLVLLHLFTVEQGGQNRHVQSGFGAQWASDAAPSPMAGPLEFEDSTMRSLAPGAEALVRVYPLQPAQWSEIEPGTDLNLCKNWPRPLGVGRVVERVDVPRHFVPLRVPDLPVGTESVMLRRKPTLLERFRFWRGH